MTENQPQEIDTKLSKIYEPRSGAIAAIEHAARSLKLAYVKRNPARRTELEKTIEDAKTAIEVLDAKAEPFEAIYRANPWTRFFLVPGGHLHSSQRCSSFRWNTRVYWLPEYSGKSEAEIVALAGERACTICYPSAPVERPSMLPMHVKEREEAAAVAAEAAAKRKAAASATITVGTTTYKTQRAAENQIGWEIDSMISRRYQVARDAEHRAHLDNLAVENERAAVTIAHALFVQIQGYDPDAILAKKFTAKLKTYKGYDHYKIPADATF